MAFSVNLVAFCMILALNSTISDYVRIKAETPSQMIGISIQNGPVIMVCVVYL